MVLITHFSLFNLIPQTVKTTWIVLWSLRVFLIKDLFPTTFYLQNVMFYFNFYFNKKLKRLYHVFTVKNIFPLCTFFSIYPSLFQEYSKHLFHYGYRPMLQQNSFPALEINAQQGILQLYQEEQLSAFCHHRRISGLIPTAFISIESWKQLRILCLQFFLQILVFNCLFFFLK